MKKLFKVFGTIAMLAVLLLSFAACDVFFEKYDPPPVSVPYVPVTIITGVPTSGMVGTPLSLWGNVEPPDATNYIIVWTVKSAGNTGAAVRDDTLTATASGTVTVTATIANGKTKNTPYIQDFTIAFTSIFDNFNKADYVIINESGKPDSDPEVVWLRDLTWLMYAENAYVGDWTANYIKTNKIKTIMAINSSSWAYMTPDYLDRFYLNMSSICQYMDFFEKIDDDYRASIRKQLYEFYTHETMHLVQYKSKPFDLMKGMRPDIGAAADMLTEFLAWFYTNTRYPGHVITADMEDAVQTQSKYMILSTDPWEYDNERAKDPSLPYYIHSTPWFNNNVSGYAQHAFTSALPRESAMTPPLRQASKEDILKPARVLLACRDPKMAGVTDEALWTVMEALRKVATGESKYLRLADDYSGWYGANRDLFDNFQDIIANWDAEYAKQ